MTARRLVVVSGPSGVGKGTVVARVAADRPDVWLSVSVTSRRPRPGEVDGREYHFRTREEVEAMAATGELLEHAEYSGHLYGTPRAAVADRLAAGRPCLLEIELQGARQVRGEDPEAVLVFLAPPSREELRRRLVGRGTEDPAVVERRLARAEEELAAESEFDEVLVNDDVGRCAAALVGLLDRRA